MLDAALWLAVLFENDSTDPWYRFLPLGVIAGWVLVRALPRLVVALRASVPTRRAARSALPLVRPAGGLERCPYCHGSLGLARQSCSFCRAAQHPECWTEHGACAACSRGGPRR